MTGIDLGPWEGMTLPSESIRQGIDYAADGRFALSADAERIADSAGQFVASGDGMARAASAITDSVH
jgi:hypothetical protein